MRSARFPVAMAPGSPPYSRTTAVRSAAGPIATLMGCSSSSKRRAPHHPGRAAPIQRLRRKAPQVAPRRALPGHRAEGVLRDRRRDAGRPRHLPRPLQHQAPPPGPQHERTDPRQGLPRESAEANPDQGGQDEKKPPGIPRPGSSHCQANARSVHPEIKISSIDHISPEVIDYLSYFGSITIETYSMYYLYVLRFITTASMCAYRRSRTLPGKADRMGHSTFPKRDW